MVLHRVKVWVPRSWGFLLWKDPSLFSSQHCQKAAFSGYFTRARFSSLPSVGWEKEEHLYLLLAAGLGAP